MINRINDAEQKELQLICLQAARKGREVLLNYLGRLKKIEEKFQAGLVSEADKEAENAIFSYLKEKTPKISFLGEESSYGNQNLMEQEKFEGARWIVDPLDGTTNYIHQFPFFGVSIGLQVNGVMEVGVVDAPLLNEVFTARRGHGATLNGQRISISKNQEFKKSFAVTGFRSDVTSVLDEQLIMFDKVVRKVRGVRRAGSAALDLCYVAKGVFDFYYERSLQPWDTAAGALIANEAGAKVCNFENENYNPFHSSIVGGVPVLVDEFLQLIK